MPSRRTVLKMGAVAVAAGAVGGGAWVQRSRIREARESVRITGPWDVMGANAWLLPDLVDAHMVVPDRPHSTAEAFDASLRAKIHRTREFWVNTNSARLRCPPFPEQPRPGVTRLLVTGDSVTFGWGVADHETVTACLQAALTERGHAVEVLNAGVPALGSSGMSAYLERVAPTLGLHGVVFNRRPYINDAEFYTAGVRRSMAALPGVRFMVAFNPMSSFQPRDNRHKLRVISRRVRKELDDLVIVDVTRAFEAAREGRGVVFEDTGDRHRVIDRATGRVLIDVEASAGAERSTDATGADVAPEVYALLESDPSLGEALMIDQGHPDAEGMVLYAESLADAIESEGWLG